MGCLCSCLSLDYKALEEDGQIMHEVLGICINKKDIFIVIISYIITI